MTRTSATTAGNTAGIASDLAELQSEFADLEDTVDELSDLAELGGYLGAEIRVISTATAAQAPFPLLYAGGGASEFSAGGAGILWVGATGGSDQIRVELISISGSPPPGWQPTYMNATLWNLTTGDEYAAQSEVGSWGTPIGTWQNPLLWDSITGTGASVSGDDQHLILPQNALYAFIVNVVLRSEA